MTAISNLNIVVQQSGGAKETQNIRHTTQEFNHVVATQQKEKDSQLRTTVQHPEDSYQIKPDKESPEKRKRRRRARSRVKKAATKEKPGSEKRGNLVNTVV